MNNIYGGISVAYIRCSDDLHTRFKIAAAKVGRPMQALTDDLIRPAIEAIETGKTFTKEIGEKIYESVPESNQGTRDEDLWVGDAAFKDLAFLLNSNVISEGIRTILHQLRVSVEAASASAESASFESVKRAADTIAERYPEAGTPPRGPSPTGRRRGKKTA